MKPKKVIIIGSAYPLRGGLSNFNERLARAFLADGFETTIFTFSMQYPAILFPGKTQYSSDPKPDDLDIEVAINSVNPINWLIVGNKVKKLKPDLVIIKFWIPFMAPCLGTLARIIRSNGITKVISIIDNIIPHEKRMFDNALAGFFARSVDGFLTMSRSVLQQVELFNMKSPKLFSPHPIYDNFGEKIPREDACRLLKIDPVNKYILFFGFIRDYKGLDILLEAIALQDFRKKKVKLLVAGEFYTDSRPYYDIIKKHNLADMVILNTDFIPDSKVSLYFSAADLVVQPYKSATQSGVTQIAYHFEVPMVITNVGGLAEFVPDGKVGYVVEPNADSVAQAISDFFKEDRTAYFLGQIRTEKIKYSWDYFLDNILRLYEVIKP
ncbi:MAG: glycosyltransferase [Bacteroidales bacterium]|nr:glycosyltransferase [Bacteroidales bacterium]